jgi:hypothetical protein
LQYWSLAAHFHGLADRSHAQSGSEPG